MAGVITYECMGCGCEIILSGAEESQMRPIYCCGREVVKISSSLKQTESRRTKKKTATKTWMPRKSSGR